MDIVKFPGETDWFAFTECLGLDTEEEEALKEFIELKGLIVEAIDVEALKSLYYDFSKTY